MFIAGANFLLYYRLLVLRESTIIRDREFRFYLVLVVTSTLIVAYSLWRTDYPSVSDACRYALFQVTSIASSTGFGTADFALWTPFLQILLLAIMVVGGCSGSTAGGIKCVRAMMLMKQGYRELVKMVHPRAVLPLRLGRVTVPQHVASAIFGFFFLYCMILGISTLFITASGIDMITATSAVISALSNIGPGLGEVGPTSNYAAMPDAVKGVLGFCMIVGRLEILTVLVLLTPDFWRS
jgi:trk system potassium uptake protein TrkH